MPENLRKSVAYNASARGKKQALLALCGIVDFLKNGAKVSDS